MRKREHFAMAALVAGAISLGLFFGWLLSPAHSGTWIRDDSGAPSAQCAFVGSSGASTLCSPSDPLPTSAGTTSTTDPTGWGQQWFLGTATGATIENPIYPWIVAENQYVGFARSEGANTVDLWTSSTKGRLWTKKTAAINLGNVWNAVYVVFRLSNGDYLIGGNCGAGVTPTCTGLGRFGANGSAGQVALTGLPAGVAGSVVSIFQQSATVIVIWADGGTSTGFQCRSTNSGSSFTCDAVNYTVLDGGVNNGKAVDSPSASTWLRAITGGLARSINDGVSYTSVLTGVASTKNLVECLSSSVCLYANGQAEIRRSADGGATWSIAFTALGTNPLFRGFVDYGNGVVAALPGAASVNIFLSRDFGVSWTPVFLLGSDPQQCATPCQGVAFNGAAVYSAGFIGGFLVEKVMYSPTIGAGQAQIVSASGVPLNLDTSGNPTVNEGTAAAFASGWTVRVRQSHSLIPTTRACNTPAANTAATLSTTGVAGQTVWLFNYIAWYDVAPAAAQILTITDGGTTAWLDTVAGLAVATRSPWGQPMTTTLGNTLTLTLAAGGVGVSGKLCAQTFQAAP